MDPPTDAELQASLIVIPEDAILTFEERVRASEVNDSLARTHESRVEAYYDRVAKFHGDLSKAHGILLENLEPESPAMSLVEAEATKFHDQPWGRCRGTWKELDEKWLHGGSTASDAEILQQLRDATNDLYNVANRNAVLLSLTERLKLVEGTTPTESQLKISSSNPGLEPGTS